MKRIITILTLIMAIVSCGTQTTNVKPAIAPDPEIEQKIKILLDKMTLEEKIGQMCELTIHVVSDKKVKDRFVFNEAKLDEAIAKYKVGSILNVPNSVSQTPQMWEYIIKRIQDKSMEELGIPCIYGLDQIHGATYTLGGTLFPQEINMAASFNRENVKRMGEITAYETRACCVPWVYSPVLDLGRDPRWPRMWENFGEDSYMNAEMGSVFVNGLQGDDPNNVGEYSVAACLKHYMGYGSPVSGKDRTPSMITDREMRERHFAPFKAAVQNGALSIMVNSAINDGVPIHSNYKYLTKWLKEDLNWDGMIVTDWADILNICDRDKVAATRKEAVMMAINAGIDMSMEPFDASFCVYLKELVEEGKVSMERIDDAVSRVLRLKFRLGLFENPYWSIEKYDKYGSEEFAAEALAMAEEAEVLLKNENNLLPLAKGTKILVTGPNANTMRALNGGWSYTWQGERAEEFTEQYNTIYEAMSNKFGAKNVKYVASVEYDNSPEAGWKWWSEKTTNIAAAVRAAKDVDVIMVCIGENSYCETPGNLIDLTLSTNQSDLVKALAKCGKPIVMVLNEGRPRIIREIVPMADAIVNVLLPGNYGGDALANLVAGDVNFSAKLPYTYPRYINSLATYDYKPCENKEQMAGDYNYDAVMDVEWEFGYGISYTDYEYSNLAVDKSNFDYDDTIKVSVDVKNIGAVAGKEPVLLYSSDLVATVSPDYKRLRAFAKVDLEAGESERVVFDLAASDLAFVDQDGKWRLEAGTFALRCGDEIVEIVCNDTKVWESPNID